jgi:hypothetical protein
LQLADCIAPPPVVNKFESPAISHVGSWWM